MASTPRRSRSERPRVAPEEERGGGGLALFTKLARTALHLDAIQRECLSRHGLAFTEFSVLRLLQRAPQSRLSPSFLAEQIVCTTGAMTKLIDRLQRAGFVGREPDPKDRRGVLVVLHPAGDTCANEAANTYRAGRENVLARLEAREEEQIERALARLLEALEADRTER